MEMNEKCFKKLTEHTAYFENSTNIGIIDTPEGILLVDTGNTRQEGEKALELLKIFYPEKKLFAIMNTHSHADHTGGNKAVKDKTNCRIYAPEFESKLIEFPEILPSIIWGGRPFKELKTPFLMTDEFANVTDIYTQDEMDFGSVKIKTIALEGHFFDQNGLLVSEKDSSDSTFFIGDALMGMSTLKKYWIPFVQDAEKYRESVEKIENTNATYFLPSHGDVCTQKNIHECAENNKIATLELEAMILKTVKNEWHTAEEILKAAADYSGLAMKMSQYLLIGSTVRSYISSLYDRKLLVCQVKDNRLLWKKV